MSKRLQRHLFIVMAVLHMSAFVGTHVYAASFHFDGMSMNKKVKSMHEIKRKNVVTQSLDFSCGAAGLSTVLQYYLGDKVTEEEIILTLLQTVPLEKVKRRRGFSLLDLKNFAKLKGYKVTGYKMDMEFLRELGKPVLVPIKFKNYSHFVIIRGVYADRVFIADPSAGNVSLKISKFKQFWHGGIGLVVEGKNGVDGEYELQVNEKDLIVADYKNMSQRMNPTNIMTTIYTSEWK